MKTVRLGRTGLVVSKNGFGCLPIQRISDQEAAALLQRAYGSGVNFYDTARMYTDSENKLGLALSHVRDKIIIATKTEAVTPEHFWADLEESLRRLKTDYVDIYQFHNPSFCPKPGDGSGVYEAMLEAKRQGKVRHIGITNHRLAVAKEAIESGLYETLQFPFNYLATDQDMELVRLCKEKDMGFIAMKGMSGGLLNEARLSIAWMDQFENVEPIWGIQRPEELEEFLACMEEPVAITEEIRGRIERDRAQLSGDFCRGCGYCMPCPAGIPINNAARMSLLIRRSPAAPYFTQEWQEKMARIDQCIHCNHCVSKCPYGLNTPDLLARNYQDYKEVLAGKPL